MEVGILVGKLIPNWVAFDHGGVLIFAVSVWVFEVPLGMQREKETYASVSSCKMLGILFNQGKSLVYIVSIHLIHHVSLDSEEYPTRFQIVYFIVAPTTIRMVYTQCIFTY